MYFGGYSFQRLPTNYRFIWLVIDSEVIYPPNNSII
jgi:hypothetical protein